MSVAGLRIPMKKVKNEAINAEREAFSEALAHYYPWVPTDEVAKTFLDACVRALTDAHVTCFCLERTRPESGIFVLENGTTAPFWVGVDMACFQNLSFKMCGTK